MLSPVKIMSLKWHYFKMSSKLVVVNKLEMMYENFITVNFITIFNIKQNGKLMGIE